MTRTLIKLRTPAVLAALAALLVPASAGAAGGSSGQSARWTRTLSVELSARDLGLHPGARAPRLARAAIARYAGRLGLRPDADLRLADQRRLPGRGRALALRQLRFNQTAGGLRVVWSQLDVTLAGGRVRSIDATVVPVKSGPARGKRRVSRSRALAIARGAVPGAGRTAGPYAVAYAGTPTTDLHGTRRAGRRGWVVQVERPAEPGEDAPAALCVVVDAENGEVIARWPGMAARPTRAGEGAAGTARAATARRSVPPAGASAATTLLRVYDGMLPGQGIYATFDVGGDPHVSRNWPALGSARFSRPRTSVLDRFAFNAENVARTICVVRSYCGKHAVAQASDPAWSVIVNTPESDSHADRTSLNVYISHNHVVGLNSFNDVIAHEFGHVRDWVNAGDRFVGGSSHESLEVEEALADMFAYDCDRGDATIGEETAFGAFRDWANPGTLAFFGRPYPAHMRDYDATPFPNQPDPHFNSTILSHGYFLLAQRIGPTVAGDLLNKVSATFSPRPTFHEVAQGFVNRAAQFYPDVNGTGRSTTAELAQAAWNLVGLPTSLPRDHRTH